LELSFDAIQWWVGTKLRWLLPAATARHTMSKHLYMTHHHAARVTHTAGYQGPSLNLQSVVGGHVNIFTRTDCCPGKLAACGQYLSTDDGGE